MVIVHGIHLLTWPLFIEFICCNDYCNEIQLLSLTLYMENVCCHGQCSLSIFDAMVFIQGLHLLSLSLYMEYICCMVIVH